MNINNKDDLLHIKKMNNNINKNLFDIIIKINKK